MAHSFHKNVSVDSIFFFAKNVTIVSVKLILSRKVF